MRVILLVLLLTADRSEAQKSEPALGGSGGGGFRGSDRYDFALVVPASTQECFWHFAHQSGNFYVDHMVQWGTGLVSDHRVRVRVLSPDDSLISSTQEVVGQIHFQTEATGFYQVCLGNQNQFGALRVFLNFGVVYGLEETDEHNQVNSTLLNMQVLLLLHCSTDAVLTQYRRSTDAVLMQY
ncbi:Transmembrane emp24 domain-containing protein 6 [Merluccius polli]|uniref:Transmembrane emp24 domain-containing protein 6 n=1 Tax=Merluccius polli TaxID=89951 RepID=A0AA47NQT7_MERPO|nr:Transmembrane emp24 domain-containing protein 6 [Merluccius polli]